jgi:hypothetical protein
MPLNLGQPVAVVLGIHAANGFNINYSVLYYGAGVPGGSNMVTVSVDQTGLTTLAAILNALVAAVQVGFPGLTVPTTNIVFPTFQAAS